MIAAAVQAGVLTRFGVVTRSAWLMRRRPRTPAESIPATLTRIFETLACRVFRDMRRFLALHVSSEIYVQQIGWDMDGFFASLATRRTAPAAPVNSMTASSAVLESTESNALRRRTNRGLDC